MGARAPTHRAGVSLKLMMASWARMENWLMAMPPCLTLFIFKSFFFFVLLSQITDLSMPVQADPCNDSSRVSLVSTGGEEPKASKDPKMSFLLSQPNTSSVQL